MATLSNKLARSLAARRALEDQGLIAIPSARLSRTHRQRLLLTGFIREVMKGWYRFCSPDEPDDPTGWAALYWTFIADYLRQRFGTAWCLGPEESLRLWAGDWTVPSRLLVRSPRGGNKPTNLPHGTVLLDLRLKAPEAGDLEIREGLRLMALPAALIGAAPGYFAAHPDSARAALALLGADGHLGRRLREGGHSVIAGRLAGALRNVGSIETADRLVGTMRAAGYSVNERDPFDDPTPAGSLIALDAPEANRLRLAWRRQRAAVIASFPRPPPRVAAPSAFLDAIDAGYCVDAFHALSLEGYQVTTDLIERARATDWSDRLVPVEVPLGASSPAPPARRDALAARGYWLCFQAARQSLELILAGENPGAIITEHLASWYRALYAPQLAQGLQAGAPRDGFRHGPGARRFARHVPPHAAAVPPMMRALFDLLRAETDPAVRVVSGHLAFLQIQPFIEGNGPIARLLMNLLRVAGGYPWLVIPLSRRVDYRLALERAHLDGDIAALARFLAG
jgi:hypothetical protein